MPHCLKCKTKTDMVGGMYTESTNKKGTAFACMKGSCSVCGSGMCHRVPLNGGAIRLPGEGKGLVLPGTESGKGLVLPGAGVKAKGKVSGGLAPLAVLSGVAGVASILNSIGVLEPVKGLVASFAKELEYMILNPSAAKWRSIYVDRLPNLAKRWRDLGNDIVFLQGKPKQTKMIENKINRINRKRADIVSLAEMLITQLPIYKAMSEAKDAQLQEREQAKVNKKINELEGQLANLKGEGVPKKK